MAFILQVISGLVSFGCLLYVAFQMLEAEGALKALFGVLCCQIYVYLWGWFKLEPRVKFMTMGIWTVAIIISAIAASITRQELAAQGVYTGGP